MQPSWEVEFDALLASSSGTADSSAATTGSAETNAISKLQALLPLSTSQILKRKGLNSVGECLNDLAADDRLSNDAVTRISSILERTREYFGVFEKAFRAKCDLKAATVVKEALRPKVKVLKVKKEQLADLDRQIQELPNRRSIVASELAKDFESSKACLIEYAASTKRVEQLKMDKRNRQAEVIMGEVRWLELKAALEAFLPSST